MINKPTNRGFTLIETMVAVLILATAIAGPLTIASKSLVAATVAKDQITAFFLAQDAVEFIRFARDTNKLQGGDWITGVGAASGINLSNCRSTNGCYFDSALQNPTTISACSASDCKPPLSGDQYLFESNGRYSYNSGGTKTIFVREVIITDTVAGEEISVVVRVHWSDTGGTDRKVEVQENLFNWQ
ncbi:MAG: type II secretion system protein [Candidatus Adlerbacteria bacterium]|nr:type II secretion system protein [Candidatus Adlerbacteria bacterium]